MPVPSLVCARGNAAYDANTLPCAWEQQSVQSLDCLTHWELRIISKHSRNLQFLPKPQIESDHATSKMSKCQSWNTSYRRPTPPPSNPSAQPREFSARVSDLLCKSCNRNETTCAEDRTRTAIFDCQSTFKLQSRTPYVLSYVFCLEL